MLPLSWLPRWGFLPPSWCSSWQTFLIIIRIRELASMFCANYLTLECLRGLGGRIQTILQCSGALPGVKTQDQLLKTSRKNYEGKNAKIIYKKFANTMILSSPHISNISAFFFKTFQPEKVWSLKKSEYRHGYSGLHWQCIISHYSRLSRASIENNILIQDYRSTI